MYWRILVTILLCSQAMAAEPARLTLTLKEAETRAIATSLRMKASDQDVLAAREQADAQWALLLPKFSLDGNFRYVSVVPSIQFGAASIKMGDNSNYSIGPTLTYTLWDQFSVRKSYQSLLNLAEARSEERKTTERQVLMSVRTSYVRVQLAREEYRLVQESLDLARSQFKDISQRLKAGAASRLDSLNSAREVAGFELRLAQSRADLEDATKDLATWIGETRDFSTLELDPLQDSAKKAELRQISAPDSTIPQLQSQEKMAQSAELAAQSQSALRGPQLLLQARASYDYPNGPILQTIQQNSISLNLSLPLLEWGRASSLAAQKRAESLAFQLRKEQAELDFNRDWKKATDRFKAFLEERQSASRSAELTQESAKLTYQAYQAGRANYLDVQSVNLRALESRVQVTRIDAQLLLQFHLLRSLASKEEIP